MSDRRIGRFCPDLSPSSNRSQNISISVLTAVKTNPEQDTRSGLLPQLGTLLSGDGCRPDDPYLSTRRLPNISAFCRIGMTPRGVSPSALYLRVTTLLRPRIVASQHFLRPEPGGVERDSSLPTGRGRLFGSRNSSKEIERVFVFNPETSS